MSYKLTISVTKEILEKSKNCGGRRITNCAIALAIRDIFPFASVAGPHMRPFSFDVNMIEECRLWKISLPFEAARFIRRFDICLPSSRPNLPEFSFELEVPDKVIDKIDIESIRPLLENHPTLKLVEHGV